MQPTHEPTHPPSNGNEYDFWSGFNFFLFFFLPSSSRFPTHFPAISLKNAWAHAAAAAAHAHRSLNARSFAHMTSTSLAYFRRQIRNEGARER